MTQTFSQEEHFEHYHLHHMHVGDQISWQAKLLNLAMKKTVKPVLERVSVSDGTLNLARRVYDLAKPLMTWVPDFVSIEKVQFEYFDAEWIRAGKHVDEGKVLLYLHGGGYFFSSAEQHRPLTWRLSGACRRAVLSINYRMAPKWQFKHWLEDAVTAYKYLLEQGYSPDNIMIGGDSAGGNLTLITLQNLRHEGLPLPAAVMLFSPWTDISGQSESMKTNKDLDPMFAPSAVQKLGKLYAQDVSTWHPWVSPAKADFTGLPPMLIMVGSTEVLRDDSLRVAERARAAGVPVVYEEWKGMPHVFPLFAMLIPEGKRAYRHIARFVYDIDHLRHEYESH